jgi:uncharacterized membrane protein AbrB (regulator of aidB expression)
VTPRTVLEWIALLATGAGAALMLQRAGLPAPWLIGPILVAIVAAVGGLVEVRSLGRHSSRRKRRSGC